MLFVDLVGFTADSERLDPEDVRAFLDPYYARVRAEVERRGGLVEKFIGDAVMGLFGAPVSHGDDPERAVRAALAVRDWADEQDGLDLRVAVNTGEAIVTLDARPNLGEAMVAGDVVNTASRLQSAAPVGGVIVGEETYASTRTVIDYRPAQPVVAKGKSQPAPGLARGRSARRRGRAPLTRAPMVGRKRELEALSGIWERVSAERRPHLVTVFGPAGIGKSRLALELAQQVASLGACVMRGRSTPYGASSPYSAFAQHIKQIAGVFDSDQLPDAQAKLRAAVEDVVGPAETEEHAANLAMLIGLDEGRDVSDRETLFFSARVLIETLAAREPTLLVFEDIHWADPSLLDLLETLATRTREVPLLLLALARPELLSERPGWGGGLPAYTALPLDRLSDGEAHELAERLLAARRPQQGRRDAHRREGRRKSALHRGARRDARRAGRRRVEQLPTSIRAIVAARLDALPPPERALLLDASVVGRVFWRGALARLASRTISPRARLARSARFHPPRGRLADPGRPAVRLQARLDPGRRLPDAAAGGAPRAPRGSWPASSRRRSARSGSRTRRSRTTDARPAITIARSSTSSRPATRPAVAGRRSEPSRSTVRRWSSSPRTTTAAARSGGASPSPCRPPSTSPTSNSCASGSIRLELS